MSIPRNCLALSIFLAVVAALFPAAAVAQQDELVTIYFKGFGDTQYDGNGVPLTATLTFTAPEARTASNPGVAPRVQISQATLPAYVETPWKDLRVEVGRTYHLTVDMDTDYIFEPSVWYSILTPPGYVCQYGEIVPDYRNGGAFEGHYSFRIVPDSIDSAPQRAGTAERLASGRTSWGVSLGARGNGSSAGSLRLLDVGFDADWNVVATPAGLKVLSRLGPYLTPAGTAAPYIVGALRQMKTPQAMVDIIPVSSSEYELRFYDASLFTETIYPYDVTGKSPYIVYNLKQPAGAATKLVITKKTYGSTGYPATPLRTDSTSIERTGTWPNYNWTLDDWNDSGAKLAQIVEGWSPPTAGSTADYQSTVTSQKPGTPAVVAGVSTRQMKLFPWGEAPLQVTSGPASANLTTTYTYYTDANDTDSYSRLKTAIYAGGAWEAYEYYGAGEGGTTYGGFRVHRPFQNSPASPPTDLAANTSGEITKYWFTAPDVSRPARLAQVEKTINGTLVSKTEFTFADSGISANSGSVIRTSRYDWTENNSATRLKTVTRYYYGVNDGLAGDHLLSLEAPDKTKTAYAYHRGSWDTTNKTFTPGSGSATRVAVVHGTTDSTAGTTAPAFDSYSFTSSGDSTEPDVFYLVNGQSTMEITIRDARALVVRRESKVWDGTSWQLVSYEDLTNDSAGFLFNITGSTGSVYSATYNGELKTSETDATGVVVSFDSYDSAGRLTQSTRAGAAPVPAVTTSYVYDASHRLLSQTSGGATQAQVSRGFDTAGRITAQSVPGPNGALTTNFSYDATARTRTTTLPTNQLVVETVNLDGSLASITSTNSGAIPRYFTYSIETGTGISGQRRARVDIGANPSSRYSESWVDWLGRPAKTSRPGFAPTSQPAFVEQSFYHGTTGQLIRSTRTGYADALYEYDAMGRLKRSGLDVTVGSPQALTDISLDRITETDSVIEQFGGAWWLKDTVRTFFTDNSGTKKRLSTTRTRLSGFTGSTQAETRFWDAESDDTSTTAQTSRTTVAVDRTNKTVTETTERSGVSGNAVRTLTNGLATSEYGHDGVTFSYTYDSLLRLSTSTDPRTGATTTAYKAGSSMIDYVQDPATYRTTYTYDSAGRVDSIKDPENRYTRFSYDSFNRLYRQWGSGARPVEYSYDATYGDRTLMKTFRAGTWGDSWDATAIADFTKWGYDDASGLLKEKYDGNNLDSTGNPITGAKKVAFEYNQRGQISKRTWARGVYSTYAYDGSTGELTGITYSDSTTAVGYSYTRTGQLKTATSAAGTQTFTYDSTKPWRLDRAELGGFYSNRWLTSLYQTGAETNGMLGRDAGFQLGNSATRNDDLEQKWDYFGNGRFYKMSAAYHGGSARAFTYGYEANSSLLKTLAVTNPDSSSSPFSVTRTFDPSRDLVTTVQTKWSTSTVAQFNYGYTPRGQRDWEVRTGLGFQIGGQDIGIDYQYNDRGELTKALTYLGTTITSPDATKKLPNLQHEFDYDNAGNRTSANQTGNSADADTFVPDAANQLTKRDNKKVFASGTTDPGVSVSVAANGGTAASADTLSNTQAVYWSKALTPANGSGPNAAALAITATQGSAQRADTRTAYVGKQSQQTLTYDDDGNLKTDGLWNYSYDAENRLIQMTTDAVAVSVGFPNRTLDFKYDDSGRRVQKHSLNATAGTETYRRYLYDGWNLVAEFDSPGGASCGTLLRSYTWGLDLAGSPGATGGVGALLQISDYTVGKSFLPAYDGNGNVMALYDADGSGTAAVVYEYSPYGEPLRATIDSSLSQTVRDALAAQPFRLSTKFTDTESGLVYYGKRFYSPSLGRFISRDPIEEAGGLNLYGFTGNDPINAVDVLGMQEGTRGMPEGGNSGSGRWFIPPWEREDPIERLDQSGLSEYMAFIYGNQAATRSLTDYAMGKAKENAALGNEINNRQVYKPVEAQTSADKANGTNAGKFPDTEGYYSSADEARVTRALDVIDENRGLRLGQMSIESLDDARDVLFVLGLNPDAPWPRQRAVYAIRSIDAPEEVKRHALLLGVGTLDLVLIQSASLPGFRTNPAPFEASSIAAESVWALRPFARGGVIERVLGANLPRFFPVFDKFENGVATSIKSLDLAADSYKTAANLERRLNGYVDSVAAFKNASLTTKDGVRYALKSAQITTREVQVVIPRGVAITPAQQAAMNAAQTRAQSLGVKLVFTHYP